MTESNSNSNPGHPRGKAWAVRSIVIGGKGQPVLQRNQRRGEWFYKLAIFSDELAKMDDHQLLWCLMKSRIWKRPIGSTEDMILQELSDRLYPEFDGEKVIWTESGWITPDGEIRYVN
jgi:hypothetical protein